jgi:hypothetical protein
MFPYTRQLKEAQRWSADWPRRGRFHISVLYVCTMLPFAAYRTTPAILSPLFTPLSLAFESV